MTSATPKALLVGASGQIGTHIRRLLKPENCLSTSRQAETADDVALDLAKIDSRSAAEQLLEPFALNAIYCVAGMTNVEACEDFPDVADHTNCRGPALLAAVAKGRDIPFVYFSTEYVFDGTDGPYTEDARTHALSAYGRSKLNGEHAVAEAYEKALVLRTTVVYGEDQAHKNYAYSVIRALRSGKPMRVPADQISTPTYNKDIAAATIALVELSHTGIFHVCGPEVMDRMEFATTVADAMGLDTTLLVGVPTAVLGQKAPRPLRAGLLTGKLTQTLTSPRMRPLAEGIEDSRPQFTQFMESLG